MVRLTVGSVSKSSDLSGLEFQLAADHLEADIVDGVAVRVAGVDIGHAEVADHRPVGVLGHRVVTERDIGGRLVDVGDGDHEGFVVGESRAAWSVAVMVRLTDGSVSKSSVWPALSFSWPPTTSNRTSSTV